MKTSFFLLALLLIISCSIREGPKETATIMTKDKQLKGKVRWVKTGRNAILTIYDERGNVTYSRALHLVAIAPMGFLDTVNVLEDLFKYDKNDSLIEQQGVSSFGMKYTYKYDTNHNMSEINKYNKDGSLYEAVKLNNVYDGDTRTVFRIINDSNHICRSNLYDKEGNMLLQIVYSNQGKIKNKVISSYSNKKITEKITHIYYGDSTKEALDEYKKEVYKYNKNGNKIEFTTCGQGDSLRDKTTYIYDRNNNLLESDAVNYHISFVRGVFKGRDRYKYNDKNTLIEQIREEINGIDSSVTTTTYSDFDSHDNYLKETRIIQNFENNKLEKSDTNITVREIEYYD